MPPPLILLSRKRLGGKYQRRVLQTLHEANGPLTTRQLRIRCGLYTDVKASSMRMACMLLVRRQLITRLWPGVYILTHKHLTTRRG